MEPDRLETLLVIGAVFLLMGIGVFAIAVAMRAIELYLL